MNFSKRLNQLSFGARSLSQLSFRIWLVLVLAIAPVITFADSQALQCIQLPQRASPCPNLIYTSVIISEKSQLVCLCKSDKQALLSLIQDTDNAKSRVSLRKLLSEFKMTSQELQALSQHIAL